MNTFTNGSKVRVWGHEFSIVDLREKDTMFQDDCSYYGSSRTMVLKASYTLEDDIERQEWADAIELQNGESIWLDGACYYVIVTDIKASNGLMFMTKETYNYTAKLISQQIEEGKI